MKTKVFAVVLGAVLMIAGLVLAEVSLYMEYITMLGAMIFLLYLCQSRKENFASSKGFDFSITAVFSGRRFCCMSLSLSSQPFLLCRPDIKQNAGLFVLYHLQIQFQAAAP